MLIGPMLKLCPCTAEEWRVRVDVILAPGQASPALDGRPARDEEVVHLSGYRRVSWQLRWPRAREESLHGYRLDGRIHAVRVPGAGLAPRVAFFSCNGFSSVAYARRVGRKNALWEDLMDREPHVLIGGGDQVYGDELFGKAPLKKVENPRQLAALARPPAALTSAYFQLYARRWMGTEIMQAMASVPGIYTWDDHEIFDGWGSYPPKLQDSRGFQAMFNAAAAAFDLIQVGPGWTGSSEHRYQALRLEGEVELVVIALDLRSCRTREQVLGEAQWAKLKATLRGLPALPEGRRREILVVSSIPLIYLRFASVFEGLPTELQDDLIDHWESPCHRGEQLKLINNLLEHVQPDRTRVTVLSGDVHVASRGQVVDTRQGTQRKILAQLTSSGIVHPGPNALETALLRLASREGPRRLEPGLESSLSDVGAETIMPTRNWLSLWFDKPGDEGRLWAQWRTEEGPVQPLVVLT